MRLLPLLLLISLSGCATTSTPIDRYKADYMKHPIDFAVPNDSATIMWNRAKVFISNSTTLHVDSDSLLQTPPPTDGRLGLTIRRSTRGDSTIFAVRRMDGVPTPRTAQLEAQYRIDQPSAHEAAFYMRTARMAVDYLDSN